MGGSFFDGIGEWIIGSSKEAPPAPEVITRKEAGIELPEVDRAKKELDEAQRYRKRKGRASTILTDPNQNSNMGVGTSILTRD